jgi:hypothetical protein
MSTPAWFVLGFVTVIVSGGMLIEVIKFALDKIFNAQELR